MKKFYFWLLLPLCGCAGAEPALAPSAMQTLTVPNHYPKDPACVIRLPQGQAACTADGCNLPSPKGSTLDSIELKFSCLPKRSPTEFDRPADNIKVLRLHTRNSEGNFGLIDDTEGEPQERLRELSFCLYGRNVNFCGFANVLRLKDGAKGDATKSVKAFIENIELQDP